MREKRTFIAEKRNDKQRFTRCRSSAGSHARRHKSFLVLFFKKEPLALPNSFCRKFDFFTKIAIKPGMNGVFFLMFSVCCLGGYRFAAGLSPNLPILT
jgi:hypothetical protein